MASEGTVADRPCATWVLWHGPAATRRLLHLTYTCLVSNAKAWTLPSSHASWPIGLEESLHYPIVLLVEGGPDLLAAAHFAWCEGRDKETAIVAVMGASHRLKSYSLTILAGKRIRIFSHNDRSGIAATKRWAKQLKNVGSVVDAVSFDGLVQTDGAEVSDLNDLCNVHADTFEQHEEIQNF